MIHIYKWLILYVYYIYYIDNLFIPWYLCNSCTFIKYLCTFTLLLYILYICKLSLILDKISIFQSQYLYIINFILE